MKIAELFGKGKTVFSCEVFPPKKTSPVDSIYKTLDGLKDIKPDFISVTYGAGGSSAVNQSTREIASIIENQYHIPAMAHLTCVACTKGEVTELLAGLKQDGVENVLKAVRGFAKGRVVALFGCGGDRDRTKRPKMGKIAADLADFCVVTSDNPRTEEPKAIIDDILEGMKDSDTPMQVIVDRPEAIHWALAHAQKDDIIVLMGKGHETYQEVNHVKHHMDEREIVADYFA